MLANLACFVGFLTQSEFSFLKTDCLACRFMPPIDPARSGGTLAKDGPIAHEIYSEVKQEVYKGIRMLQNEQKTDPKHSLQSRFFDQVSRVFPAFDLLK